MRVTNWISKACAVGFLVCCGAGYANHGAVLTTSGARGYVDRNYPLFGGFTLSNQTVVYVLVRGPSLRTLANIPGFLDLPWVRLYDGANRDLINENNTPGTFSCLRSRTSVGANFVVDYYQNIRRAPVDERDTCFAFTLAAGVYTFDVRPAIPGVTSTTVASSPSAGEVLFEVTLNP